VTYDLPNVQKQYNIFLKSQKEYEIFYYKSRLSYLEAIRYEINDNKIFLYKTHYSSLSGRLIQKRKKLTLLSKSFIDSIYGTFPTPKYYIVEFSGINDGGMFIMLKHNGNIVYELQIRGPVNLIKKEDRDKIGLGFSNLDELSKLENN
jgi:hypothetical protein